MNMHATTLGRIAEDAPTMTEAQRNLMQQRQQGPQIGAMRAAQMGQLPGGGPPGMGGGAPPQPPPATAA